MMKVMREADQVIPPDLERMAAFGGGGFGGPTRARYGGGGGGGGYGGGARGGGGGYGEVPTSDTENTHGKRTQIRIFERICLLT